MANYKKLSNELSNIIEKERKENTFKRVAFDESRAIRRLTNPHDEQTVWRTAFIRDVDKILNCPFYNRYSGAFLLQKRRFNPPQFARSISV